MAVAHQFGVFEQARPGHGVSVAEFANSTGIAERPAELLLTACAGLGLLRATGQTRYENTPIAEEYLVAGKPQYFGGIVQLFDKHSAPGWMKLEEALRDNAPKTWDPATQESLFDNLDPTFKKDFWTGMYSLSIWTARTVAERTASWMLAAAARHTTSFSVRITHSSRLPSTTCHKPVSSLAER